MLALNHRKDFADVLWVKAGDFVLSPGLYIDFFFRDDFQNILSEISLHFVVHFLTPFQVICNLIFLLHSVCTVSFARGIADLRIIDSAMLTALVLLNIFVINCRNMLTESAILIVTMTGEQHIQTNLQKQ